MIDASALLADLHETAAADDDEEAMFASFACGVIMAYGPNASSLIDGALVAKDDSAGNTLGARRPVDASMAGAEAADFHWSARVAQDHRRRRWPRPRRARMVVSAAL